VARGSSCAAPQGKCHGVILAILPAPIALRPVLSAAAGSVGVLAQSPAATPTRTGSATPRWGAIAQPGGFVLVVLGNATNQVSSTVQWQVPVTLMQFPDCGLGCNASALAADRVLNVPSTISGDANLYSPYSDRPFSMSGDGTKTSAPTGSWILGFSTYQQGRLVISDDQQVRRTPVMLGCPRD
jgi:hypothetical protein